MRVALQSMPERDAPGRMKPFWGFFLRIVGNPEMFGSSFLTH